MSPPVDKLPMVVAIRNPAGAEIEIEIGRIVGKSYLASIVGAGVYSFRCDTGQGEGSIRGLWFLPVESMRKLRGDDAFEPAPPRRRVARPKRGAKVAKGQGGLFGAGSGGGSIGGGGE